MLFLVFSLEQKNDVFTINCAHFIFLRFIRTGDFSGILLCKQLFDKISLPLKYTNKNYTYGLAPNQRAKHFFTQIQTQPVLVSKTRTTRSTRFEKPADSKCKKTQKLQQIVALKRAGSGLNTKQEVKN